MRSLLFAVTLTACATTPAGSAEHEANTRELAEKYLNALSGTGDESGRALLLGGVTANAQLFVLENWKILGERPARHEEAELELANQLATELDTLSKDALKDLLGSECAADAACVESLTPEQSAALMKPTKDSVDKFTAQLPVLAKLLNVGEPIFINPKNPARKVLAQAGAGRYVLDIVTYDVETFEGPRKVPRKFPLKLARFKSQSTDTGWKVLPPSDWNAE